VEEEVVEGLRGRGEAKRAMGEMAGERESAL